MFMCRNHWFSLPQHLRAQVLKAYRPGQCDDFNITTAYAQAAQASIRFVAGREGRQVTGNESELTLYDTLVSRP
jgi:hypothetical protein